MDALEVYGHAFSDWLNYWQDLAAGVIGAIALASTVWVTLHTERSRKDAEAAAFRIALGVEIRQLAAGALNAYQSLRSLLGEPSLTTGLSTISAVQLGICCRLPAPVVYPCGANKVGMLGERAAFDTVYFYGQLALIREHVHHVEQLRDLKDQRAPVTVRQVLEAMRGLLNAVKKARDALTALKAETFSDAERVLAERFAEAHDDLEKLRAASQQK